MTVITARLRAASTRSRKVFHASAAVLLLTIGLAVVTSSPAAAETDTCNSVGYTKGAAEDQPSGSETYPFGTLSWSDRSIQYDIRAGFTVELCIKASTQVDTSGPIVGPAKSAFTIDHHSISHIGYRYTTTLARDASATVSTTPPTCEAGEHLVLGDAVHSTWGTPTRTEGPGAYSVTATASSGHLFTNGDPTKTFSGTLSGPLDADASQCRNPIPVAPAVSMVDECGTANDSGPTFVADNEYWTAEVDGSSVVFTAKPGWEFADGSKVVTEPFIPNTDAPCTEVEGEQETDDDGDADDDSDNDRGTSSTSGALEVRGAQATASVPTAVAAGLGSQQEAARSTAPGLGLLALLGGFLLVRVAGLRRQPTARR